MHLCYGFAIAPSSIVTNEIKMKDEAAAPEAAGPDASGAAALALALRNNLLMTAIFSIVGGHRPHVSGASWADSWSVGGLSRGCCPLAVGPAPVMALDRAADFVQFP